MSDGFLGCGWAFPVAATAEGDVAMASAQEDVRQAVLLILETQPGERVMRPDFGAGLRDFVFEPINASTLARIRHRVREALITWEPRIDVGDVTVSAKDAAAGVLAISIDYTVRSTNTFYNLVLPFAVREARV